MSADGARKVAIGKAHDIVGLQKQVCPNNGFDLSNAFVTQSARFGYLQIARQFAFAGQANVRWTLRAGSILRNDEAIFRRTIIQHCGKGLQF